MRGTGVVCAVLAALILLTPAVPVSAQAPEGPGVIPLDHLPALRGDYFRIESAATGRPYHIYVRYPEGYDPAAGTLYPTVYLTDGDSLFPILAANHLFLHYDEALPEALVVGIAYGDFDPSVNHRHVDFTAPAEGVAMEDAHAARFQQFLRDELIPEVERRYRSNPQRRVLFGQSRGGGFVFYSALTEPDLFWGRIASNPAFRPEGEWRFRDPAPALRADLGFIAISGSRDRPDIRAVALNWAEVWHARPKPWAFEFITIEGGTHAANAPDAYRAGMLWLFGRAAE